MYTINNFWWYETFMKKLNTALNSSYSCISYEGLTFFNIKIWPGWNQEKIMLTNALKNYWNIANYITKICRCPFCPNVLLFFSFSLLFTTTKHTKNKSFLHDLHPAIHQHACIINTTICTTKTCRPRDQTL